MVKCDLCGSEEKKVIYKASQYPDVRGGIVAKCKKCGLVFRYGFKNIKKNGDPLDYPQKFNSRRESIYLNILNIIEAYRNLNKILDVGSGEGIFLKLCQNRNWKVIGIEKNEELAEKSKLLNGLNIIYGSFEGTNFPDYSFDVITMINVLEHMKSPSLAIKKAKILLRHGGAILIRFPNATIHVSGRKFMVNFYKVSKWIRRFDTCTISYFAFDKNSIIKYLRRAGFENCWVKNDYTWSMNKGITFKESWKIFIAEIIKLINLISFRKLFLSPSLLAGGIKPNA